MGFHNGAIATVWNVTPASDVRANGRITISKKNKLNGIWETEFNGFVSFLGKDVVSKAKTLKEKEKVKLTNVDVTNKYDKEKNITYTNYNIFDFENLAEPKNVSIEKDSKPKNVSAIIEGDADENDNLPF